jgi:hypothetical protein
MINENSFSVMMPEVLNPGMGDMEAASSYTVNYYADSASRATMCCNCDKATQGLT